MKVALCKPRTKDLRDLCASTLTLDIQPLEPGKIKTLFETPSTPARPSRLVQGLCTCCPLCSKPSACLGLGLNSSFRPAITSSRRPSLTTLLKPDHIPV